MEFIIFLGTMLGIFLFLFIFLGIHIGMEGEVHFPLGLAIIVITFLLIVSVRSYNFKKYHTVTYIKPTIKYFEKKSDKLMIVVDDTTLYKTDFRWLNTNNIMLKVMSYKGKTNKEYVIKE
jgi:hypothetical protein